jgi:hypothetical protein
MGGLSAAKIAAIYEGEANDPEAIYAGTLHGLVLT